MPAFPHRIHLPAGPSDHTATGQSGSDVVLRRVGTGDLGALVEFYNGLSEQSKRMFRPLGPQTTLECCADIIRDNDAAIDAKLDLVAVEAPRSGCSSERAQSRIVGWGFLWGLQSEEPSFGLCVADAYHGRGLGSALMDRVLEAARQRGVQRIGLTVVQDNEKACQMYARRGFVRSEAFIGSDGLPYYRMAAELAGAGERMSQAKPL